MQYEDIINFDTTPRKKTCSYVTKTLAKFCQDLCLGSIKIYLILAMPVNSPQRTRYT